MLSRSAVKNLLPRSVVAFARRRRLRQEMEAARGKSLPQIFTEIYDGNQWGGKAGTYYSGSGSTGAVIAPYVALVRKLMAREKVQRIVDLGCGDFRVGGELIGDGRSYVGCDIVPGLIEQNRVAHAGRDVTFDTLDMVADPLPEGDLCIIKQVLQNLPNDAIAAILEKTRQYRLVLISDEQIKGDTASRNEDIPAFHGTRRVWGQGLKLERPPFAEKIEVLLEHSSGTTYGPDTNSYLRTVLIRN